jgi:hypothetical protein
MFTMAQTLESTEKDPSSGAVAAGDRLGEKSATPTATGEGSNGWADVARREADLIGAGFSGIGEAAADAFKSENLPMTMGKVALSMGLAFTLGRLRPVTPVGQSLLRSAGLAAGLSFGVDVATNGWEVGKAMADAARTTANLQHDTEVMKHSFGQFAFDTALTMPFAVGAGVLGNRLAKSGAAVAENIVPRVTEPATPRPSKLVFARDDEAQPPISNERDAIQTFAGLQKRYMPPLLMARSPELVTSIGELVNTPGLLEQDPNKLVTALNGVHRRSGLPDVLEVRAGENEAGDATFQSGSFLLNSKLLATLHDASDLEKLTTGRAKLTSVVMHEDEHLEQQNLIVRRIADKLGIGKDWLRSDVDAVIAHYPTTGPWKIMGYNNADAINPDFVQSILKLRAGNRLSPVGTHRADMLLESFGHPINKDLLTYYDYSARHFMGQLEGAKFENGHDVGAMMNNDFTYPALRADVNRIMAAAQSHPLEMTPTNAGMEIHSHAVRRLPDIERELSMIPRYGQWAHEAEAYAVEQKGFDGYVAAFGSRLPFHLPTWAQFYKLEPLTS